MSEAQVVVEMETQSDLNSHSTDHHQTDNNNHQKEAQEKEKEKEENKGDTSSSESSSDSSDDSDSSSSSSSSSTSSSSSDDDDDSDSDDNGDGNNDDDDDDEKTFKAPATDNKMVTFSIEEINKHLSCFLCGGYLRDCTVLSDCLHAFCKPCLSRHIQTTRSREIKDVVLCPMKQSLGCMAQLHSTDPFKTAETKFDRAKQNLVDKIVNIYVKQEEEFKRELYNKVYGLQTHSDQHAAASTTTTTTTAATTTTTTATGPVSSSLSSSTTSSTVPTASIAQPQSTSQSHVLATSDASVSKKRKLETHSNEPLLLFEILPHPHSHSHSHSHTSHATLPPIIPLDQPIATIRSSLTLRSLRKYITESLLSASNWNSTSAAGTSLPPLELYCNGELLSGSEHSLEFIYKTKWMHLQTESLIKITYKWPDQA